MLNSTKGLKAVCIFDPAIKDRIPIEKMVEYNYLRDFSIVEKYINKADPPTVYHFRRLNRSIMNRFVASQVGEENKWEAAFQYGVTAVDSLRTEDGARVAWKPSGSTTTPEGEIPTLTENEMGPELFSLAEHYEIGSVVYWRSFLGPWIKSAFPLVPSSQHILNGQERLSAVVNQSTAPQNKQELCEQDSAKPPPTDQEQEPGESVSERPTVVPVGASEL